MSWSTNETRAHMMAMPPPSQHLPSHISLSSAPPPSYIQSYPPPPNFPAPSHHLAQPYARPGLMAIPPPPLFTHAGSAKGKKDVKRRTKTGCLTCRKRRCDEGHPTCRNCQKSKRECLGYDPIFKPQSGHANIQPAPPTSNDNTGTPKPSTPSLPHLYQQQQQHQHHSYPATGGTFVPTAHRVKVVDGAVEYGASLDPALAGEEPASTMAANSFNTTLHATRRVKPISVDQLFSLNDIPPSHQLGDPPPTDRPVTPYELETFFRFHFALGLDKLFETTWYSTQGWSHIQADQSLLDFIAICTAQFSVSDPSLALPLQSLEASLVWHLAVVPRNVAHANATNGARNDTAIEEILPRIDIVEHLLTGQHFPHARIPPPPSVASHDAPSTYDKDHFWHQLGSFVSHPDDTSEPAVTQAINQNLNTMRGILGVMESRDVLYSLAIARYIGGRLDEFHPRQALVGSNDPNDEVSKLEVARRHVDIENQKGTTQVIQRICGMAMRSWILQKQ